MATLLGQSQINLTIPGLNPSLVQQEATVVDQLIDLQQFGWQVGSSGWLYFPVTNVSTNISQDLAIHKYPDLNAARIENTGRNPIEVTATAIFVNTITPGPKESWNAGTLYPHVYQQVLNSALDRKTGTLQHPFIGQFTAKLASAHSTMHADFRGGEILELHWIETINDDNILNSIQSKLPDTNGAAFTLDNTLQSLTPAQLASLKQFGFNPDVMAAILKGFAIATTVSLIFTNITSAIQSGNFPLPTQAMMIGVSIYNSNALINAIRSVNDPSMADLNNAAWVYLSAMQDFQLSLTTNQKPILTYYTKVPMSLNSISVLLNRQLTDIIALNPNLLNSPIVAANSAIKYYA